MLLTNPLQTLRTGCQVADKRSFNRPKRHGASGTRSFSLPDRLDGLVLVAGGSPLTAGSLGMQA